jgi:hypothetical protein
MRRPPSNFRFRFRRVVETAFRDCEYNIHLFRSEHDFDGFLETLAPQCEDERHIAFAFLCLFLPKVTERCAEAIAYSVMLFLSQSLGRVTPDGADIQAARALVDMPVKDEKQLTNWINSYYDFPA